MKKAERSKQFYINWGETRQKGFLNFWFKHGLSTVVIIGIATPIINQIIDHLWSEPSWPG